MKEEFLLGFRPGVRVICAVAVKRVAVMCALTADLMLFSCVDLELDKSEWPCLGICQGNCLGNGFFSFLGYFYRKKSAFA